MRELCHVDTGTSREDDGSDRSEISGEAERLKYPPGDLRRLFDPECKAEREHLCRMREAILPELVGGLWHTTHPDRFERILKAGAILPEPDIPDKERWKTAEGSRVLSLRSRARRHQPLRFS